MQIKAIRSYCIISHPSNWQKFIGLMILRVDKKTKNDPFKPWDWKCDLVRPLQKSSRYDDHKVLILQPCNLTSWTLF